MKNIVITLALMLCVSALATCQRPAPESQRPAPAPQSQPAQTWEAMEMEQHISDSLAALEPDSVQVMNIFGIWRVGDQTLDLNGAYDYLKPSEFPGLPQEIAAWLEERDYTIPQVIPRADTLYSPELARPHNAFGRQLSDKEQTDWLVYCNAGQKASIYIFWGGSTQNVERLHDLLSYLEIHCCNYFITATDPPVILRELADVLDIDNPSSPHKIHYGIGIGIPDKPPIQELYKTNGKWIFF